MCAGLLLQLSFPVPGVVCFDSTLCSCDSVMKHFRLLSRPKNMAKRRVAECQSCLGESAGARQQLDWLRLSWSHSPSEQQTVRRVQASCARAGRLELPVPAAWQNLASRSYLLAGSEGQSPWGENTQILKPTAPLGEASRNYRLPYPSLLPSLPHHHHNKQCKSTCELDGVGRRCGI